MAVLGRGREEPGSHLLRSELTRRLSPDRAAGAGRATGPGPMSGPGPRRRPLQGHRGASGLLRAGSATSSPRGARWGRAAPRVPDFQPLLATPPILSQCPLFVPYSSTGPVGRVRSGGLGGASRPDGEVFSGGADAGKPGGVSSLVDVVYLGPSGGGLPSCRLEHVQACPWMPQRHLGALAGVEVK